jgi:DNA-binding CsgD family transcriptional regulator
MPTERERARRGEKIEQLADASISSEEVRSEAICHLREILGFERWCWPVSDPVSLLQHSGVGQTDYWSKLPTQLILDQCEIPVSKSALAKAKTPAVSLHAQTHGDMATDPRWRIGQRPFGMGDELTIACRDDAGCWGYLQMHRDSDQRPFDSIEVEFAARIARSLGIALRRALIRQWPSGANDPISPGVLIIDRKLRLLSSTAEAREWLSRIPGADIYTKVGMLPSVVYSVASRKLETPNSSVRHLPGNIRVRTVDGRWATFDSAPLDGDASGSVAVTVRASAPQEVLELLARACRLTPRETELVTLLLKGLSTRELADRLFITQYTVKDHLKSVFAKVGVRSRRELVGQIIGMPGEPHASELAA